MWLIRPPISFRDLGNLSWTIGDRCFISCVLTYYSKAAWLAKGQGQRSRSRPQRSQNSQNLKAPISSLFFLARASIFCMQLLRCYAHVHCVNYHKDVWLIMPNLVLISFRDLDNISWTIEGNHFISCVLTYHLSFSMAEAQAVGVIKDGWHFPSLRHLGPAHWTDW